MQYLLSPTPGVGPDEVLETLRLARSRIANAGDKTDDPVYWDFSEWNSCTCGHVYAAAIGEEGTPADDEGLHVPGGLYAATLKAIAAANAEVGDADGYRQSEGLEQTAEEWGVEAAQTMLAEVVSNLTSARAREMVPDSRAFTSHLKAAALGLLDNAIGKIELEHEAARLKLAEREPVGA